MSPVVRKLGLAAAAMGLAVAVLPFSAARASGTRLACQGDPSTIHRLDITVDGVPTFGYYALPRGTPKGMVVFAHGYQRAADSWFGHLTGVAALDGVITLAMDNHGQTDTPPTGSGSATSRGWRVQEGADDMVAAARLFAAACAPPTIVDYGVSMGGNTSGLAAAARPTRPGSGNRPLFDRWFDIEGATNVVETYTEAVAYGRTGNVYAQQAQADIEQEMGGTLAQAPSSYLNHAVVTRAGDIKASGIRGVVIVHGVADGLVPSNQSREIATGLVQQGVPTDVFTVITRRPNDGGSGTTLDGAVIGATPLGAGYNSPFAGHASESSATETVVALGLARLDALLRGCDIPSGHREFVVDGTLGTTVPPVPAAGC
jgi:pimeloyl-ACP methyl ester carboxylesterase